MSFEVASVRPSKPGTFFPPNFPLDSGDAFVNVRSNEPPHGRFSATFPLISYVGFAYRFQLTQEQRQSLLAQLPKWVATDAFEIQARATGDPTKDQMRLVMQSLLAERFHLELHFETHEVAVFAMTLAKPGRPALPAMILRKPKCRFGRPNLSASIARTTRTEAGILQRANPDCGYRSRGAPTGELA